MQLSKVNELLGEAAKQMKGTTQEVRTYRMRVANPGFRQDAMARYDYEYFHPKMGWRTLKNLSIKTQLLKMTIKQPKLVGTEIKIGR